MAVTYTTLKTLGFIQIKGQKELVRPVGDNCMLLATGNNIYMNGVHLINTEYIDIESLKKYLEKAVQAKRRDGNNAE
jgi:hypothetical protein